MHVKLLCVTLWTAAHQAPPSTGFSRQEYWSGLPFPSLGRHGNDREKPGEKIKKPRGSKGVVAETGLQVLSQIPTGHQTFARDFYQQRTVQVRVNLIGR